MRIYEYILDTLLPINQYRTWGGVIIMHEFVMSMFFRSDLIRERAIE